MDVGTLNQNNKFFISEDHDHTSPSWKISVASDSRISFVCFDLDFVSAAHMGLQVQHDSPNPLGLLYYLPKEGLRIFTAFTYDILVYERLIEVLIYEQN